MVIPFDHTIPTLGNLDLSVGSLLGTFVFILNYFFAVSMYFYRASPHQSVPFILYLVFVQLLPNTPARSTKVGLYQCLS